MTPLLLMTHGKFGQAALEVAASMMGPPALCEAISLDAGMGREELESACAAALQRLGGKALVLVDMLGGTPWNVAAPLALKEGLDVYGPLSIPVLLEALAIREKLDAKKMALELKARCGASAVCGSELLGGMQGS